MEEMLEDTFESMEDGEDMEEEAEEEVDKILFEITAGEKMCSALHFHCVCLINMYPKSSCSELQFSATNKYHWRHSIVVPSFH